MFKNKWQLWKGDGDRLLILVSQQIQIVTGEQGHPERAITTSDFSLRYLQVLGCFDSPGFSFARKTIKVANISSGRFCVTWRSHPNKEISYLTHVCYGNNVSIYHELVFFYLGYHLSIILSSWCLFVVTRLQAMCCVLAGWVESEWLSSDAFQVPSPWVFCPTNIYKRSQINIINILCQVLPMPPSSFS